MVAAGGDAVLKKKVKKIKTAPATADVEAVPSDKKIKKQKSTDAGQEKEVKKKKRKAESEAPSAVSEEPVKKKKAKKAEPEAKGPSPAGSDSAESEQCALDISDSKPADPLAIDNFRLSPAVKALLRQKGIEALFHIQAQTLTSVLDGFDLVGRARYHTRLLSSCISIHLSLSPWLLSSMGPSPVVTSWLLWHPASILPLAPPSWLHLQAPARPLQCSRTGQSKALVSVLPVVRRLLACVLCCPVRGLWGGQ